MSAGALGLLETRGLVPLAAGIEAMCRVADVDCVLIERVSSGVLVAAVRGDLASVEHAIQIGKRAAERYGEVRSVEVYPHPHESAAAIVAHGGAALRAAVRARRPVA